MRDLVSTIVERLHQSKYSTKGNSYKLPTQYEMDWRDKGKAA